jgi:hypothetical protein
MKQQRIVLRRAAWLLLAAAALPSTIAAAQDQGPITEPPVTVPEVTLPDPIPVPQPPVTQTTPPASQTTAPTTQTAPPPAAETRAPAQRRAATRSARTSTSTAPTRSRVSARPAAPVTAAATPAAATPAAPVAAPAPVAEAPVTPPTLPVPQAPVEEAGGPSIWTWLIGGALVALLGFALLNMLRHRRRDEDVVYDEAYADEPVGEIHAYEPDFATATPVADSAALAAHGEPSYAEGSSARDVAYVEDAPVAAAAVADLPPRHRETLSTPMGDVVAAEEFVDEPVAVAEDVAVAEADPADVEALAAASAAPGGRPWLEFLMRPIRAGTSQDSAIVEFELTIGNTGSAPARDVRISTFMFPAGSSSEMERMLIEPPADSSVDHGTIAAGEATRLEAQIALPRETIAEDTVLPVVVADARYVLPDGSEGRTRASFEVGIPTGDGLDPFPIDRVSGLVESVEARLHGEPQRV